MVTEKEGLRVFMFPWLAHGHISPFLELAKKLADHKNFHTYLCSTPVNLGSIKNKIPEKYSVYIHLLELHLPSLPELPPHYHTTNGLPLHLHSTLSKALKMSKPNLLNLLETLKPDVLIHDVLQPWAGAAASLHNIPAVSFFTSGATMCSYFCHLGRHPGIDFPFPATRLSNFELSMALKSMDSAKNDMKDSDDDKVSNPVTDGTMLMNSSREMEGKYMDYLSELINWKITPVGALVQDPNISMADDDDDCKLIKWLEEKNEGSTVFVSFGSEYFLKKEDMEDIAYGLELSNVNFIWVVRFAKGDEMKVEDALPKGFLERIGGRAKIVEKWAPQAKILTHSSVGGFVSHCGWNSLMESIDFGVPIIAMPMHLDQPMNAKLVVELGVGVEVKRDENGRFQREEISRKIKDVVNGENGVTLRRNVEEKREKIKLTSREELDGVIEKLTKLSGEKGRYQSRN